MAQEKQERTSSKGYVYLRGGAVVTRREGNQGLSPSAHLRIQFQEFIKGYSITLSVPLLTIFGENGNASTSVHSPLITRPNEGCCTIDTNNSHFASTSGYCSNHQRG